MNKLLKSAFPPLKKDTLAHYFFISILLIGFFLRFYQYLMGRSLWEDEAHMALNFFSYGYRNLMNPLDHLQMAPILFLFVVETFTRLFGVNEYALRVFPFIASILTLPLFYHIVLNLTKNKATALFGFLLFSINLSLIYFSSELKVYAVDVSVYLLMIYLVLTQHPFIKRNRTILLIIAGSACILCSNMTLIVLCCVFCYMISEWVKNRKILKEDIKVLTAWAIVFVCNYIMFIRNHPHTEILQENYAFTFCPSNIFSDEFVTFIKTRTTEICSILLYIPVQALFLLIIGTGYIIWSKQYYILFFTCLPILLHLILSMFKIYPFYYRFILYLVPAFIILLAIGVSFIYEFIRMKLSRVLALVWVFICTFFLTISSSYQFPLWFREVKPSLDYINKNYSETSIYITTPMTLYTYYYLTGYVKNGSYHPLEWNITPEKYYELVQDQQSNYLLFHATDFAVDGYKDVLEDLRKKKLIVKEFEYKTYTVSEVKPLSKN